MGKALDLTNAIVVQGTLIPAEGNDYSDRLLKGSITQIKGAGAKLDARIHATAHALMSRGLNKDCSLVPSLIDAMPKSGRRKALIAWFHAFSNIHIRDDAGKITAKMVTPTVKSFKLNADALLLDAWDKPFWSVEEGNVEPSAFTDKSMLAAVNALIKRATSEVAALSPEGQSRLLDLKLIATQLTPVSA